MHHHARNRARAHHDTARAWPADKTKIKGPYEIVISIARQQVALYGRDGLTARAGISTGRPDHPTPMGVFSVLSKARWHRSNIYSGAPMPYMQRITWSGIALHAGPRPGYPASHGCIRLPADFAIHLFHTTKVGTRVVVTRDAVAPVAIASPKLLTLSTPVDKAAPVAANATGRDAVSLAARSSTFIKTISETSGDAAAGGEPTPERPASTTGTIPLPTHAPADARQRSNEPVAVFVSRKQKRLFVRQGFHALFDMPVTIADPDQPIGTHIYTAMGPADGGTAMRWTAISIPSGYHSRHHGRGRHRHDKDEATAPAQASSVSASAALARITLPAAAIEAIAALMKPGSSLIVSDNRPSDEMDSSTGFIVLTR